MESPSKRQEKDCPCVNVAQKKMVEIKKHKFYFFNLFSFRKKKKKKKPTQYNGYHL